MSMSGRDNMMKQLESKDAENLQILNSYIPQLESNEVCDEPSREPVHAALPTEHKDT